MSRDWKDVKLAAVEARKDKADELARVTAERDRLREALKECVTVLNRRPRPGLRPDGWAEAIAQAKAALDGKSERKTVSHNYQVGQEVAIVQPPNSSRERVPYAIGKVVNVNGDEIVVEWEGDSAKFAGSTHRGLNWPSYYAETEISANPAEIEHVKKWAIDGKGGGE